MMRFFTFLLLLALFGLNLYHYTQIQDLRAQVAALQRRETPLERARSLEAPSLEDTLALLAKAKEAAQNADYEKAQRMLTDIRDRAADLQKRFGAHAGPTLSWLRKQAEALEEKVKAAQ